MRLRRFSIVTLCLLVSACDSAEKKPSKDEAIEKSDGGESKPEDGKATPKSAKAKGDAGDEAKKDGAAGSEDARFEKEALERTCELLTADMVAKAFEVDASKLEQRGGNRTYCQYEWDGGKAAVWHIDVEKTAEEALSKFDASYRAMSGKEVADAMGKINEQVDKQDKEGKLEANGKKVDADQAKGVSKAIGGALSDGFTYEPVEGIGDKALWNPTKRVMNIRGHEITNYDNKLHILISNAMFQIEVQLDDEGLTKEQALGLAKLVLAGLE